MSDADSTDEFEPVEVFETTDMDLRSGSDDCYKCSTCDTSCPVAEVDDEFPGPKFQGPEQWRLKRKEGHEIDDSITGCSNCMRCDDACPSSVPLSQMHNTARGEYVESQRFGREALAALRQGEPREALEIVRNGTDGLVERVRNRVLANYRTSAWLASKVPWLANRAMNFGPARWLMEATLGVTKEREFPAFADQTFREWWVERGGAHVGNPDKQVAYFHGCYSNFNTPEVAKAMVHVFEEFGYEVLVPPQKCSGTPMFANGMLGDARRHAETNVENLAAAIDGGADIVASCTSCSMALRQEYPELFDLDGIDSVAAHTYEAVEYLRLHEDLEGELAAAEVDASEFAYHAPCHARNQGIDRQAIELFSDLDGATVEDVGDSCSGISGTYGWKEEKYDYSMEIGEEMFEHMESADGETGMTECPTCAMQMEHGTGYEISHPLELLEEALV
ncbi:MULTISPECIES: anaerobic glycerol-3-phosphate dehydrogenase subunit C [Halococcus]|uniref:sn-glycerol-3-phosphate dehydrogenase subunit C n=1 Tax=Halococcus salifodinae DSM 8989 TaxID=1227456 RepID=M0MTG7_9EURY|nr:MULTISPECIES: anaerobic glycerol-3-phosphate dehydrogenase subunit C [Halococcus]EMA49002.1 sn-glycerol-3-phosphate dehydrogenase subunit C [Halococcus salifodinae DSM 8989]